MQQDGIEEVSDALAAAWRDGGSVKTPADLWSTSIDDSLAIQDAFDAKVGEEIVGWKIAMSDKLAQRTFGLDHPAFRVGACRRNRFRVIDDWISPRWWPALHWATNTLSRRGLGMRAGQTMTTGSAAQVLAVPGAGATMRYGGDGEFGEIRITIA